MTEDKATQEKIQQLQQMEQQMTQYLMQKQQFQNQLVEVESALSEMNDSPQVYRIIGNIMVSSTKEEVEKELKEKKEKIDVRIQAITKQEKQLQEKAKVLQEAVLATMKK